MLTSILIAGAILAGIVIIFWIFAKIGEALPEDFFVYCVGIVFWGVIIFLLFVFGITLAKKGGALGVIGGFLIIFGLLIAYVAISNLKDEFK